MASLDPIVRPTTGLAIRRDLALIADLVTPGSRVLDVGCGEGALLDHLAREKGVDARGIERERGRVNACVKAGLAVIQGDADNDLPLYPDRSFDYAILSLTLQAVAKPADVLRQLVRIGNRAVVSFPNFGHWRVRLQLLTRGRMPVTGLLDDMWYATENIHLCTILDFLDLTEKLGLEIEQATGLTDSGRQIDIGRGGRANLIAEQAIFVLRAG